MASELFGPIVSTDELLAATGDRAWVDALLDSEVALAAALADVGMAPPAAAHAIAAACAALAGDTTLPGDLGRRARDGGNPVIPLVATIRDAVGADAAGWVHHGATSQDVMDTAAMLVVARALPLVEADLGRLADGCAQLARRYRDTTMAGRTLLQQAQPITFGLKAAGWLDGVLAARRQLDAAGGGLAAQLGGAVGTLAAYDGRGPEVLAAYARRAGLNEPLVPWHTARHRVVAVGAALAAAATTAGKISRDVALLMQTEVSEVSEPRGPGRGASSSMPHKRNPVGAAAVSTAVRRAHALLPVLFGAMVAEHERDLGGWQAEWEALSELLALAGGAVARTAETVGGLTVHPDAMAANLARTGGVLLSERVTAALAPALGQAAAAAAVRNAADRAVSSGSEDFAHELLDDPMVAAHLDRSAVTALLDPPAYVGAAGVFVDRVLAAHAEAAAGREAR